MKEKVDLIVYNAIVYTVDSSFTTHSAFAVKDGKFVKIGKDEEIINLYTASKYLDAEGNALFPGFNDAHAHLFSLGESLKEVDLRGIDSFEKLLDKVTEASKIKGVKIVIGHGWDQNLWEGQEFPDNKSLNERVQNVPVILNRIDYHAVLVNQKAIDLLGIKLLDGSYPHEEAIIVNGEFSGIFLENSAERFKEIIPEPDLKDLYKTISLAQTECFKNGLTSVSTAGENLDKIRVLERFQKEGKLKLKVDLWLSANSENTSTFKRPYREGNLNVSALKLYIDGALGSRGALMKLPYSDDRDNRGIKVIQDTVFRNYLKWAYENGFQVATHCIGDEAVHIALKEYGAILKTKNDKRWRIEHAQTVDPNDLNLFSKYSIIPSVQPTHATSDMIWAVERLGSRITNAYINKELLDQNGWIPSGTDFPIEEVSPINTFYSAVFRKNSNGYPDGGFQMQSALSREEAIRSMTIWAAKASFEEDLKGSIEVGKAADFVLLDTDLIKASEGEVKEAKVLNTFVNGSEVYTSK